VEDSFMSGFFFAALVAFATVQDPPHPGQPAAPPAAAATCDTVAINPDSYKLIVEAQALNFTKPYYRWWDNYDIGTRPADVEDLDDGAMAIAERARELDDRNLLAHAHLARQYLIAGVDATDAHEAWRRTLEGGGAVVWMATLFEVDDRAYFVLAFDRQGIRVFRFGQLAGAIRMNFGVPALPGSDHEDFWRALGGCIPDGLPPEATIPWSAVREIEAGNFVLWFELDSAVTISSDRGRRKRLNNVMVNLHTSRGDADFRYGVGGPYGPMFVRPATVGPAAYQARVRGTLIQFFDPDGRIKVPPQRRSGW
jgi:hypothetical protein